MSLRAKASGPDIGLVNGVLPPRFASVQARIQLWPGEGLPATSDT